MSNQVTIKDARSGRRKLVKFFVDNPESGAIVVAIATVAVFSLTSGGVWLNLGNLQSVVHVTAVLAILAAGESLVIGTGEIDISIGSIFGIGAFVFLGFAPLLGVVPAFIMAIAAGCIIGGFNGYISSFFGVSSLIVTLGSLFIFRGIALLLTENKAFSIPTATREQLALYDLFGAGTIYGFNVTVIWTVILLAVFHMVVFFTPFGNQLLATGGHADSALSRGVKVRFIKLMAFVLSGGAAALAGVMEAGKTGFADGSSGRMMELEAIAACVVGGCLLKGGRISIIGILAGAFLLSSIQSYLVVMSVTPQLYLMVLAAIVIAVMLGDDRFRAWANRQL
jgi:ribose transport system permease protein